MEKSRVCPTEHRPCGAKRKSVPPGKPSTEWGRPSSDRYPCQPASADVRRQLQAHEHNLTCRLGSWTRCWSKPDYGTKFDLVPLNRCDSGISSTALPSGY